MRAFASNASSVMAWTLLLLSLISAMQTSLSDLENQMMDNGTFTYSLLSDQRKTELFRKFQISFFRKVVNISDTDLNTLMY